MNIKKKRPILLDEVYSFLKYMENTSEQHKNEKSVNRILLENYTILPLDKTEKLIDMVNLLDITKDEKLNIINYKPKDIVELSVIIPNYSERMSKKQIEDLFKYINENKINK